MVKCFFAVMNRPSGLQLGWFLALAGIVLMIVGGSKRAAEVERRRKPPGVM